MIACGHYPAFSRAQGVDNLDDSGCGRGWLLVVLCRFSAVVSGWRVSGGWRCCPMCSGSHRLRPCRGVLLSGSQGRGGWSGGCWQGAQPLPAGQEGVLPGPGAADLQHALPGVTGEPGGQVPQPVAQRVRLGVLQVVTVVEAEQPAPGGKIGGDVGADDGVPPAGGPLEGGQVLALPP